jgi:hypothetical protein
MMPVFTSAEPVAAGRHTTTASARGSAAGGPATPWPQARRALGELGHTSPDTGAPELRALWGF